MSNAPPSAGALGGLRVVDASEGIAGPLAGMMLADFGADVVKVEPPGGDRGRATPGFAVWNRGKRSVVIDAKTEPGRARLALLVAGADVCITGSGRGALTGMPLDPDTVCRANPSLVFLHTPPYTDDAPWAGAVESHALLAAVTGVALRQASFDGGPVDSIVPHLLVVQGLWAAAAAVAALYERERSGRGQTVTVAGIHGVIVAGAGAFTFDPTAAAADGATARPGGPGGSVPFYRTYQCEDGEWLFLAALTPHFTERAFRALAVSDLLDDERLGGAGRAGILKPENLGWVIERMAAAFRTRPRAEWLTALADAGCPAGPVLDRGSWLDSPQIDAIGMRATVEDPERGPVVMPGIPVNLTASPASITGPAPRLGEHDDLEPWPSGGSGNGRSEPEGSNGPLAGVRVLDLGAIIAGPFAASLLAELGADVIKVEPPSGDTFRGPGFAAYNKGQRGVVLDLREPRSKDAFLALVAGADVVIDNYRPGVLDRLGMTYDALRAVSPGIITMSITGFGDGGPLGGEAGFDPVLQAMSGMMAAQGGDSDPVFFTVPVNDVAAAAAAAFGTCLALLHRERGSGGQRAWTSLAAMSAVLQADHLVRWPGRPAPPVGGRDHPGPGTVDRYHRVIDGWVRVQAETAPPGPLATLDGTTRDEAVDRLAAMGIPAAPARRAVELAADPELVGYGVLHHDVRPDRQHWWTAGRHAHFGRTPRRGTLVAPALGEHTREVLLEAGIAAEAVEGATRSP